MNIKSKKIFAQLLAVAAVGGALCVPFACMNNPVINVSAAETTQESGWQKAYTAKLKEEYAKDNNTRFALAYIDNDDVPELVLSIDASHVATSEVYVYFNGNVVKLSGGGSDFGRFEYAERENIICSNYFVNGVGGVGQSLNRITSGECERIVSFFKYVPEGEEQEVYQVDGEEVTEEEYNAKKEEYKFKSDSQGTLENDSINGKSFTVIEYADMYEITDENINEYIGTAEETPAETSSVKSVDIKRTIKQDSLTEYAVLTATDDSGNVVWTYTTKDCPMGQCEAITPLGKKDNAYYIVEYNTITALDYSTGKVLWQNNDFEGSGVCSAFGENAIYIGSYLAPDFCAVSYDGKIIKTILHLDEDYSDTEYYWVDKIEIVDNKYAAVHFGANDGTLYVDLETYEVLESIDNDETNKEPAVTYEWYIEPSVETGNINAVDKFMGGILDEDDDGYDEYEYDYGRFTDTGYAVIQLGDYYGIIDMNGNMVVDADYIRIHGEVNNHFTLYDEDNNIAYFCCETGEFLEPDEPYCAWCENDLSTCVCSSYYCYDPERKLLAYISELPGDTDEDGEEIKVVSLKSQNGSQTTIDFPEGVAIPVRKVSIISEDEVELTDDYGIMKDGEIIVDFNYYNALSYKDGVTALESDDGWYYFDEDGNLLIEDPCDPSLSFGNTEVPYLPSEDYIAFNTVWGGGYYSTDGEVVIPVGEFAEVRPVFNGVAWVKDHETGLWGVIELTGERAGTQDDDDDSDSDDEDGGSGSSSNSSSGKASPKTGDDFGGVLAAFAVSAGVMIISRKRKNK